MLSNIKTIALNGLEGELVEVQTDIAGGLPDFAIVGLPDTSVKESKERIKTAIKNSGIEFPSRKILINLAPSDIRKWGTSYDLPIAISVLGALKEINNKNYVLDMKDNVEDDTSILKSELYKTTIMLKESAENSLKDKLSIKEFIEDTSHQLKTPLASISIILDNLIDNPNMDNKLRESFLKDINREISKINNLVNTMLKLSMFEVNAIKFDRKYNSLKGILEKSIENVSLIMDLKNVKVNLDIKEDVLIKCDYNFEVEAISNILKNEVEYSKEFGKIDITVNDNKLYTTLIIKDYGIGISENDLKNIFNRFYRGENSSTNSAGIGLSLAKKIILMDNGKISVESKKNEYTIFKIKYYKA